MGKEKKDIRLIGLDLDGTTLTTEKELTPHTRQVLETCLEQGIQVLPATGRARSGIPEVLLGIRGLRYVLLSNGASVLDLETGETVYENCISWERALELMDLMEECDSYYDFYAWGRGWSEARFYDHTDQYHINPHIEALVKSSRTRIDDMREWLREHQAPVEKFNMFFATEEKRQEAWKRLHSQPDIAVTFSLENNLEINHATCNKGNALMSLGKHLHLTPEQIMACGDGNNDYEMIRRAGVGVAMANGEASLREIADYVTATNDEDGVASAIELFCHLQV